MATELSSKNQARFCTTSLPIDLIEIEVEVDDTTFHLHKFPFMSKSRKLHQLVTEQEQSEGKRHEQEEEVEEEEYSSPHIRLENFPGGTEIFETVVKVCYGGKVDLSACTVVQLRCAAEYLEMTEEFSPDNLISKTERFLSQFVFNSIRESIKALKACESVSPLAESLGITSQCIKSIVSKASSADPSLFGWPINNGSKKQSKDSKSELWFEDLTELSFPVFRRLIVAMKLGDLSPKIVERSLISYAKKHIFGISRCNGTPPPSSSSSSSSTYTIAYENQQRELLETITSYLPLDNSSVIATVRSLFGLLRSAIILNASERCRTLLERKIGSQLEKATLDDLLIPSYSYLNETLYDIDLMERLIAHFLQNAVVFSSLTMVGKLIDGVLGEIASDANLKPEKFYNVAISLPNQARLYDDGLYRAIDIYLKAHPWILETEKEKICSVMDCQKLTIEGCIHAAQNERLPLRAVVEVLFFEQLQLREAIVETLLTISPSPLETKRNNLMLMGERVVDTGRWKKMVQENQMLRMDMDKMSMRVQELERECSNMKKVIAEINKESSLAASDRSRKWSIGKKFGCKFQTQVCDSHEATMVDRRSRRS